ncbi:MULTISPECIES: hypothetical protein [unclassified Streptomyces]|uniref:hypothetical protein n=1 Tax=unclassified Streptomyces TaxID=2593676 RepID=UPI000804B30C|nr:MULTISPECIES: hypothetical protein [unclassified Streptomyces]MYR75119.1 hypothetical protein [Streptomyces sp. SID4925]SBU97977.1 hypothetical protein YUMDRAFT_05989 [Streptomyces sp. OspMP-M45]
MSTDTRPDQMYLVILGAAATQASINARVLAEHGDNQLGRPWTAHPGLRIWNGNLIRLGHHNPTAFLTQANNALPTHMYVDHAHHEHAHLTGTQWVYCAANADGAVPLTIAITQTRETTP